MKFIFLLSGLLLSAFIAMAQVSETEPNNSITDVGVITISPNETYSGTYTVFDNEVFKIPQGSSGALPIAWVSSPVANGLQVQVSENDYTDDGSLVFFIQDPGSGSVVLDPTKFYVLRTMTGTGTGNWSFYVGDFFPGGIDKVEECSSYTWIDGKTYTSSNNTATFLIEGGASDGRDSLVALDLTILRPNTGVDEQTACDSYVWIDGNTYTESNNIATFTLTNVAGCDSVVTLDLTVNYSNTGTDVQTACNSYVWIDGNTYTESNSTATFTLTNAAGCDSVVTLDLTINSNTGIDVQTACDSYVWIDGNTYTESNNIATFTLTNAAGCDSVVTLDLTINSNTGTDVQTACDSYVWIDGNTYTESNSTATFTLTNAAGCDSVVTLDLTIDSKSDVTAIVTGLTITANSSSGTYQWLNCDSEMIIEGETSQAYTATDAGNYAVIIDNGICSDTSDCFAVSITGISSNSASLKSRVYPNPAIGVVTIVPATNGLNNIAIYDMVGTLVYIQENSISEELVLDIEDFAKGIYMIQLNYSNDIETVTLIKE